MATVRSSHPISDLLVIEPTFDVEPIRNHAKDPRVPSRYTLDDRTAAAVLAIEDCLSTHAYERVVLLPEVWAGLFGELSPGDRGRP